MINNNTFFKMVVLGAFIFSVASNLNYIHKKLVVQNEQQLNTNKVYVETQKSIKQEIDNKIKEENKKQKKKISEKKQTRENEIDFIVTFYSDLDEENGTKGGIDCKGNKLTYGIIANNQLPYGTKVHLDNWGDFVVKDRGDKKHFNRVQRVDMFIPRNDEEENEDEKYKRRIENMGKKIIKGHIVRKEGF